jgi:hypothetical protein
MTIPPHFHTDQTPPARVILRYGIFTIFVFALILVIWWMAHSHGPELFSEGSPLEWIQFGILIGTSLVLLHYGLTAPRRPLALAISALPAMAATRELDKYLDEWLPVVGWQLPFYLFLAAGTRVAWSHRKSIPGELGSLLSHRAAGVFWAGFIIAIPFAQMIGHGAFLKALYDIDYERSLKRIIEECAETIGYLVLLFGAIDWSLSRPRH